MRRLISALALFLWGWGLPVVLIREAHRFAGASEYAAQICRQIGESDITPPFFPALICAAAGLVVRRRWFSIIMAVIAPLIGLMLTQVNGVSVFTVLKIALEYLRLGAF